MKKMTFSNGKSGALGVMKEEDIRPAALMADKRQALQWDIDFLLSSRASWVEVNCPACGSVSRHQYGKKNGFVYAECEECFTVYTNPRPPIETLHQFYEQSKNYDFWNKHIFPKTEEVRRNSIFKPRAARVANFLRGKMPPGGTLIEVGAAFGWFCEEIRSYGIFNRVIAVEPTPGLAETCRKKGIETIDLPIESVCLDQLVDVIASFEVIEHLFSPKDFIIQCSRLLKSRGLLVLTCPNVKGFDVGTLGVRSATFDHEHMNYFNPMSLTRLLEDQGFEVVSIETPGRLDADIVKKSVAEGLIDISDNFILTEIFAGGDLLLDKFQQFLSENLLSSHLWVMAKKI